MEILPGLNGGIKRANRSSKRLHRHHSVQASYQKLIRAPFFAMVSNTLLAASLVGFAAAATTNTNLQTKFPTPSATTNLAAVKTIAAGQTFDGGLKQWDRSREYPSLFDAR